MPMSGTVFGPQRVMLVEMFFRSLELTREAYLPNVKLAEAFELIVIGGKVYDMQARGRAATCSNLARAIQMPRAALHRKLLQLEKAGIVEKCGGRYVMSIECMNGPVPVRNFKRRVANIMQTAKKLSEMDDSQLHPN
jgi:DNA-binding transcriptional ArsR family regulator